MCVCVCYLALYPEFSFLVGFPVSNLSLFLRPLYQASQNLPYVYLSCSVSSQYRSDDLRVYERSCTIELDSTIFVLVSLD